MQTRGVREGGNDKNQKSEEQSVWCKFIRGYHPGNHIPAASINDYLGGVRRHQETHTHVKYYGKGAKEGYNWTPRAMEEYRTQRAMERAHNRAVGTYFGEWQRHHVVNFMPFQV